MRRQSSGRSHFKSDGVSLVSRSVSYFLTLTTPIDLKPAAMHLEIIGAEVSIEIVAFQEAPSL
jgi:hypothetical protein